MSLVDSILAEAGITPSCPDFGLQYNFCLASLSPRGICHGLDDRAKRVMRARGLGAATEAGRLELLILLNKAKLILCGLDGEAASDGAYAACALLDGREGEQFSEVAR
jgi:hypothetical protein